MSRRDTPQSDHFLLGIVSPFARPKDSPLRTPSQRFVSMRTNQPIARATPAAYTVVGNDSGTRCSSAAEELRTNDATMISAARVNTPRSVQRYERARCGVQN